MPPLDLLQTSSQQLQLLRHPHKFFLELGDEAFKSDASLLLEHLGQPRQQKRPCMSRYAPMTAPHLPPTAQVFISPLFSLFTCGSVAYVACPASFALSMPSRISESDPATCPTIFLSCRIWHEPTLNRASWHGQYTITQTSSLYRPRLFLKQSIAAYPH